MTPSPDCDRRKRLVLLAVLWVLLFVFSIKVSAGWAARSLSLLAESLHSLIHLSSLFLSLVAPFAFTQVAGRPVCGHGKRESAIVLTLVTLLGFFGLSLIGLSISQLHALEQGIAEPFGIRTSLLLGQFLGILIAISVGVTLLLRYQAKQLGSRALLHFHAVYCLREAGLTVLVLIGLAGVSQGYRWIDPLLAIVLVGFAAMNLWRTLSRQLPMLIQQTAIAPESIVEMVRQVSGVTHCYQIQSRGIVGRYVIVEMRLVVHPEFSSQSYEIAEQVEGALRERYGPVQAVIRIDRDPPISETPFGSVSSAEFGRRL